MLILQSTSEPVFRFLSGVKTWTEVSVAPCLIAGTFLAAGLVALIAELTWVQFPATFDSATLNPPHSALLRASFVSLAVATIIGLAALNHLKLTAPEEGHPRFSKIMFGRYLVGVGFVLLLDALISVVAVAGLAKAGVLPYVFAARGTVSLPANGIDANTNAETAAVVVGAAAAADTAEKPQPEKALPLPAAASGKTASSKLTVGQQNLVTTLQMLFALGFTVMGALFFFSKALWVKMRAEPGEAFDRRIFWAGLWFRLAEAIVFTLVVFVALRFNNYTEAAGWMPFIALIVGLSVKATENLIAGLTDRVLAGIGAFVGKN